MLVTLDSLCEILCTTCCNALSQPQRVRPFGGKCLDHSYRPDGCYLLLHTRIEFLTRVLMEIVKFAAGVEDVAFENNHESILTRNSLEGDYWT